NRLSQNLGGFVEEVIPSFFNKSRGDGWPDVMARYNHDDNMLLGTSGSGTLRLSVDDTGLDYDVYPPSHRMDIVELVERGDVRKSSFAFYMYEDEWAVTDQGFPLRKLVSGRLVDVAPVNTPAYMDTSVGLRAEARSAALASLAIKVGVSVDEVARAEDLRKFLVRTDGASAAPKPKTFGAAARMALLGKQDPWA
ncbi:MAG TPA: HK97 family phage prohead protease, partial [Jiangellaceae bacterium]|nr:HK97 family phage prohead protease [Jiangellaceae bacterium]